MTPRPAPQGAPRTRRTARRSSAALAAAFVWLAACSGGDDEANGAPNGPADTTGIGVSDPAMPAWLESVYPAPDGNAAERAVQVDYATLGAGETVRLVVDDVDVTAQAIVSGGADTTTADSVLAPPGGRLRYDPVETSTPLVELIPGDHAARVELVRSSGFGQPEVVTDEYRWTFTIQ